MADVRFRFECRDVADCDVVIYSEFRESVVEAAISHLKAVHDRDATDEDVAPFIEEL